MSCYLLYDRHIAFQNWSKCQGWHFGLYLLQVFNRLYSVTPIHRAWPRIIIGALSIHLFEARRRIYASMNTALIVWGDEKSPVWHCLKANSLSSRPLETNSVDIWIKIEWFPFQYIYSNMLSEQWQLFVIGLNVLLLHLFLWNCNKFEFKTFGSKCFLLFSEEPLQQINTRLWHFTWHRISGMCGISVVLDRFDIMRHWPALSCTVLIISIGNYIGC